MMMLLWSFSSPVIVAAVVARRSPQTESKVLVERGRDALHNNPLLLVWSLSTGSGGPLSCLPVGTIYVRTLLCWRVSFPSASHRVINMYGIFRRRERLRRGGLNPLASKYYLFPLDVFKDTGHRFLCLVLLSLSAPGCLCEGWGFRRHAGRRACTAEEKILRLGRMRRYNSLVCTGRQEPSFCLPFGGLGFGAHVFVCLWCIFSLLFLSLSLFRSVSLASLPPSRHSPRSPLLAIGRCGEEGSLCGAFVVGI